MKKFNYFLVSLLYFLFISSSLVSAQATPAPLQPNVPEITENKLNLFNPLVVRNIIGVNINEQFEKLKTPGGIINQLLIFIFPIAGFILFIMLVWAGFEIFLGGADKKTIESGKNRAIAAVVGFLLLFVSYWIAQFLAAIFKINLLGG